MRRGRRPVLHESMISLRCFSCSQRSFRDLWPWARPSAALDPAPFIAEKGKKAMNSLSERQVYVRLSEDGTSFFYTVKYGRFATVRREIRLAERAETAGLAELSDELPRLVPVAARISPTRHGKG